MKDSEDDSSAARPSLVSQWTKIATIIASYAMINYWHHIPTVRVGSSLFLWCLLINIYLAMKT